MGSRCCRILSWRQDQERTDNTDDDKIVNATTIQLKESAIKQQNSNVLRKQQDFNSVVNPKLYNQAIIFRDQSPITIIIQDRLDTLQKQSYDKDEIDQMISQHQQKISKLANKTNQYNFLLSKLQYMESSYMLSFLQNYVLKNIYVNYDDSYKISNGIVQCLNLVEQGFISLEAMIYALIKSIDKVNEAYGQADLFSQILQALLFQQIVNPKYISKFGGQQTNGQSLRYEKVIQQKSPRQMVQKMLTSNQSSIYFTLHEPLQCQMCLTQIELSFMAPLQGCSHIFHIECIHSHTKSCIDSNIIQIKCPIQQCKSYLTPNDIEKYLDNDMITRYYKVSLNKYVEQNNDVTSWCPTAGCPVVFQYQDGVNQFNCPMCQKLYCLVCRTEYHQGMTCQEYQTMRKLSPQEKEFIHFAKGSKFKQYPQCKFEVQKNQSCNQITRRCNIIFCYDCGRTDCKLFNCKKQKSNKD